MISVLISLFLMLLFSLYLLIEELNLLQNQFYEIKRYFLYKKEKKQNYLLYVSLFSLFIIGVIVNYYHSYKWMNIIYTLVLILILIRKNNEKIIKLKYTSRVKRLMCIFLLIYFIFAISLIFLKNNFILYLFEIIFLINFKFICAFVIVIDIPIEKIIINSYKRKAIKKIKRVNPLIIGITGSYGKTSTKNYLYQLLSLKYRVNKTPKSYNTYLGVLKSINEEMSDDCEIMIIELGVDRINGLDRVLSFLEFDISIITSIGPQHLKTFKTIENIVKEKSKILDRTKGHIFLNYNYEYLRVIDKAKYVPYSSYSYYHDSNVFLELGQMSNEGSECVLNYQNKKYKFTTNILGKHQLENLLGSICIALYLKVDIDQVIEKVKAMYNEKHRMEFKYIEDIRVIDDSYNSNVNGFKSALDVLKLQKCYRILITPGVIELGNEWEKKNRELGEHASKCADYIVLVGKKVTRPLYLGLISSGFDEENILIVDTFIEGFESIKRINRNKIVLIENDLPDFYLK